MINTLYWEKTLRTAEHQFLDISYRGLLYCAGSKFNLEAEAGLVLGSDRLSSRTAASVNVVFVRKMTSLSIF